MASKDDTTVSPKAQGKLPLSKESCAAGQAARDAAAGMNAGYVKGSTYGTKRK